MVDIDLPDEVLDDPQVKQVIVEKLDKK